MKMIIAHRGGAGLALENSATAFGKALELGVDAIELDTRLTKDNQLVVNHDAQLNRTTPVKKKIRQHTWRELQGSKLKDGSPLLDLAAALKIIGSVPVTIELKDRGSVGPLLKVLKSFPKARPTIGSFHLQEMVELKDQRPKLKAFVFTAVRPFNIIRQAVRHELDGVAMPWWLMNRQVYKRLRQHGLAVYVYGVRSQPAGRRLSEKFPEIAICTDFPDRFISKKGATK